MAEFIENIAKRQKFANVEEFYAAIGYGGVSLSKIIPRVKEDFIRQYRTPESNKTEAVVQKPKRERKASSGVIVEGLDSCLVKFAKCCNPLPGDDIIGFVTRGYGVSIHKRDCINVQNNIEDPEQKNRFVQAAWQQNVRESFKSTLDIYATGRPGIIADLSIQLANMRIALHSLNAREAKDDHTQIQITMSIESVDQLNYVINNLKKINGIISIERNIGG